MSRHKINIPISIFLSLSLLSLGSVFYRHFAENKRTAQTEEMKDLVKKALRLSMGTDNIWSREEKRAFLNGIGMEHVPLSSQGILYLIPVPGAAQVYIGVDSYDRLEGTMTPSTNKFQGSVDKRSLERYVSRHSN